MSQLSSIASQLVGGEDGVVANVTVGPVGITDNNALFVTPPNSVFADYMIQNRFEGDPHVYMMGITSPSGFQGASVAFCKLASKTLLIISDWTVAKIGSKPEIPDPNPDDQDWVLLDDFYEPAMETVMPDGVTKLYRISGTYVYGDKNPSAKTTADINFPQPPWLQPDPDREVPDSLLTKNLVDDKGGSPQVTYIKSPGQ